jgi:hypothetical protein
VTGLTTAISAPQVAGLTVAAPAAAAQPAEAALPEAALPGTLTVPDYYKSFLTLAGQVQEHLAAVGEPEVADLPAAPAALRGTQVTQAFAAAADRHRESR